MTNTLEQYSRLLRALKRIENNRNRLMEEYEDDVWFFFQNCWHLKDWVKNDDNIPQKVKKSIEKDIEKYDALCICADLANRSKHLKLERNIRRDAKVSSRDTVINAGPPGKGYGEYFFKIQLDDGRELDAIEVAREGLSV